MNPEEVSAEEEQSAAPNPPIYTCQTLLNVQTQQEASQALTPKYMKYVVFVCFGLCIVMFGLLLWAYLVGGAVINLVLALLVLAVGAYLAYSHFNTPKKMLVQWEENMKKNFGTSELHLTTEFYKFSIAQTLNENDELTVDNYADLQALVETKHLFLLKKGRGTWYFVAKDGLQNCSADEFRSFISERIGGK
ncbi:MAG: YcxB family protein [Faecousia sp.]